MADSHTIMERNERFADPTADLAHKKEVARHLSRFASGAGASGWVVEFTLLTGATSTPVTAFGLTGSSEISLSPLTAQAAALLGKTWVDTATFVPNSDRQVGSFSIQHPALLAGVVATFRGSVKG